LPELRASLVFTVQDLLADPPLSKLDFVSCRNVLIYLGPEAQAKVIALLHFALQPSGILLIGTSETVGHVDGMFESVAKSAKVYRRIGKSRPGAFLFSTSGDGNTRISAPPDHHTAGSRPPALADLFRRLVLERYAPAAVLINRRHECLYSMGPVETYLRIAPGYATLDLLAMVPSALRARLRTAFAKVSRTSPETLAPGGRFKRDGKLVPYDIDIHSVMHAGEELLLVAFVGHRGPAQRASLPGTGDHPANSDLEHELSVTRTDLAAAIHDLETSGEEHRAVNEEALSVNEEYQSANEELVTSKEELQSLNEELTALNGQLQETLERQRTTSNDLQNVLYSTDVATLFLDTELNIRFFTPATKSLFHLIPGDIGRPLLDLNALSADPTLADDARSVLADSKARDREIEAPGNLWFMRHILAYRTETDGVEGVVITFTNITKKKASRKALEVAKRTAETANLAKSRFLAAASHDLRQPLQSLALLTGLLAKASEGERAQSLIDRLDQTLATMSGMLNTMLDINQIEAGIVQPEPVDFCIGDVVNRVRGEFMVQARNQKLQLCSVHCSRIIRSDPTMLEQMLRNLISNALKYTKKGKILIGCRKRGAVLKIEVWDTGMGIPAAELDAIFDEYHQIDNAARERSLGLGLGLSIVQRLGALLGHRVGVRSLLGKGSVFSVEIALESATKTQERITELVPALPVAVTRPMTGTVLVVEDDPEVRDLLELLLTGEGHRTATAADAASAMAIVQAKTIRPDVMLADYNLPGDVNGLRLAAEVREELGEVFPVVILTGDISTATLRDVAMQNCVQLNKPVTLDALTDAIQRLLAPSPTAAPAPGPVAARSGPTVYIVDDDAAVRSALRELLEFEGRCVEDFSDCESFIAAYRPGGEACLLIDAYLPGIDGIELLRQLKNAGHHLPAIMITGNSAVPMAVEAMKVGAIDFLEKPVRRAELFASIDRALDLSRDATKLVEWQTDAAGHIDGLTKRQHQVMDMVLAGHPSKNIAADLHISQRTVENHRASIMKKTGAKSIPALARLALAAVAP
jgi:two-component system, chemotaxis family, CheB/CheR fusion protein